MEEAEQREQDIVRGMENDRKIAEGYILNYDNERKAYDVRKQVWLSANNALAGDKVGGKTNLPGSPTENTAIKFAQYDIEHPEYFWLRAVEIALKTFGERKRIFITVRREADREAQSYHGKKSWVVYTQRRYSEEIAKRYINDGGNWVSDRTIRKWWALVLDRVVEIRLRLK
jgi:hypothetical protein